MGRSLIASLAFVGLASAIRMGKQAQEHVRKPIKPFKPAVKPNSAIEEGSTYQFTDFVRDFGRTYEQGTDEWFRRSEIFNGNMQLILKHNTLNPAMWTLGVNTFMDQTPQEKKKRLGYKAHSVKHLTKVSNLEVGSREPISLPEHHDWRPQLITKHLKHDQGACGSCWAVAAVSTLEHHVGLWRNVSVMLSAQSLVSCSLNEHHCGGTGGCQGSTAELAFDYIVKNGIPAEVNYPYKGRDSECAADTKSKTHVMLNDYVKLPENKQVPLLEALYTQGPVAVSVDAGEWFMYNDGVFHGCSPDATINHAVVAQGFGQTQQGGRTVKYFLLQNSWGPFWGEDGHIRIQRFDSETEHCGTDYAPEDGTGCDGGPATVPVCGMCGILYDSCYPTGTKFKHQSEGGTFLDAISEPIKL